MPLIRTWSQSAYQIDGGKELLEAALEPICVIVHHTL
jgi:hypothetical protein